MNSDVLVTRLLPEPAMGLLRTAGTLRVNPDPNGPLSREDIVAMIRGCDYLCCMLGDAIDGEIMDASPSLKIIANVGVGFNNIEVREASKRGIMVTNTPGALTETTADLTWALILGVARRVVEGDVLVRASKFNGWGPMLMLGSDVYGKTLGVVGFGRIGQAVARRAAGFGMRVLYSSTRRAEPDVEQRLAAEYVSLPDLLGQSDFVSLHVPYRESTHHLIGAAELCLMKPSSFLINTARGAVVDEAALVSALSGGSIAGAGLDVYEHEPALTSGLAALPNTILLPHVGSASLETRTEISVMAARNVVAAATGERPPNLVNPEVWSVLG